MFQVRHGIVSERGARIVSEMPDSNESGAADRSSNGGRSRRNAKGHSAVRIVFDCGNRETFSTTGNSGMPGPRRNGNRVQGPAGEIGATRRVKNPRAGQRTRPTLCRTIPTRSPGACPAKPFEHRDGVRFRREGGPLLFADGVRGRTKPAPTSANPENDAGASSRDRAEDL